MQEFAANAATALHLNRLIQDVPNLSTWLLYLLAVLGLLCCFFGYKLRNLWFAAVCLVFGCLIGSYLYSHEILDIHFSVGAGLLAATLFVLTHRLAAPEIGFSIALFLLVRWLGMDLPTAILPSILLGVIAFFLGRWVVTLTTAIFGAFAVVNLMPQLPLALPLLSQSVQQASFFAIGILGLLGFLVQFGFGSSDPLIPLKRK